MIPNGQLIGRVAIAGNDLELADVTATVTIRFGRVDPADSPTASTLQLELLDLDASSRYACGDLIELDLIDTTPRFRGQVTDLQQSWGPGAALSLTAVGNLARVSRRKVGNADWPQEPWSSRVARLFADADGWSAFAIDPATPNPLVAARLAAETTVEAELSNLAVTAAAAVVDLPDGSILLQPIAARTVLAVPVLELPPELVLWAPDWLQSLDVVNVVDVSYGTSQDTHTVTSRNTDSVTRYGERQGSVGSTFALEADAAAFGAAMVNRRGYPHWIVPSVQLAGMVTPRIGGIAHITELPEGSPHGSAWGPVIEGWTDTLVGDSWQTMLQLSDPIRSGVSLRWRDVPSPVHWMDVDPATSWAEAVTLESLGAV